MSVYSVNYLYGNIEYARKNWKLARRWYEESLRIGLTTSPIHPITTAAYYSLGCVEFEFKHHDNARQVDRADRIFHSHVQDLVLTLMANKGLFGQGSGNCATPQF